MGTYYKIRKKSDPTQFVRGTPTYLSYDTNGRIFQSLGALRTFITGLLKNRRSIDFSDLEVVELETVVTSTKDIHDVVKPEKILMILQHDNN